MICSSNESANFNALVRTSFINSLLIQFKFCSTVAFRLVEPNLRKNKFIEFKESIIWISTAYFFYF